MAIPTWLYLWPLLVYELTVSIAEAMEGKMGCRGFAVCSLCKTYTLLGITGAAKRRAIKSTTDVAERASR